MLVVRVRVCMYMYIYIYIHIYVCPYVCSVFLLGPSANVGLRVWEGRVWQELPGALTIVERRQERRNELRFSRDDACRDSLAPAGTIKRRFPQP